ncbi:hypothetical protein WJX72_002853 [[Myrmecia] bisecta]|uniref:Anaphase-promoting complex subunit 1 n=1 Tax=[Myrmecia] bisecta TaxID=41462 RepID=A0AAW1R5C1_9CHLO
MAWTSSTRAVTLGSFRPYGEELLEQAASHRGDQPDRQTAQYKLCGGASRVQGDDSVDEEIYVAGRRVIWSAGRMVRKRFTTDASVSRVAWCHFQDSGDEPVLCLLQPSVLTTYALDGELQTVPLPAHFTNMWALPEGLLLTGPPPVGACILPHPLEELHPVAVEPASPEALYAQPAGAGWDGETVIWASAEVPFVTTYNEARGRLAIWQLRPARSLGPLPIPTVKNIGGLLMRTPAAGQPSPGSGAAAAALGSVKRPSILLPDGGLSPAAFSPVPRSAALTAAAGGAASLMPRPQSNPSTVVCMIWEQQVAKEACPTEGHLAADADGTPLLCLLSRPAQRLTALCLPSPFSTASAPSVEVAFSMDALAAAAISATRPADGDAAIPPRDLLVLHANARLALYIGARHICDVAVTPPPADDMLNPYSRLLKEPAGPNQGPGLVSAGKHQRRPLSRADSDISMGSDEDGMAISPRSDMGPDVKALGVALEGQPEVVDVKDVVGNRVTLALRGGSAVRVALPLAPTGPLPKQAMDALAEVLAADTWHALFSRLLVTPGAATGDVNREWNAFATLLKTWAAAPSNLDAPPPRLAHTQSGFTSEADPTPSATPGGSADSGSAAAWEQLLQSSHHRKVTASRRYPWLDAESGFLDPTDMLHTSSMADRDEVWQALYALHSVYEDFKLHTFRWHLLPKLGKLLYDLALLLGALDYADHYLRDLGPSLCASQHAAAPRRTGRSGSRESVQRVQPADIHRALHGLMAGRSADASMPLLATKRARCVQRSADLADLYGLFAETARQCAQLGAGQAGAASAKKVVLEGAQKLVLAMVDKGWDLAEVDSLPMGVALPLREAMQRCRASPPAGWPVAAYVLIRRDDIAATIAAAGAAPADGAQPAGATAATAVAPPSMVLETPLGKWARSPRRPRFTSRTPIVQPQLNPLATGGNLPRSRLSMGGDLSMRAAAATPPLPPPQPTQQQQQTQQKGSQPAPPAAGSTTAQATLPMPYTQRLQIPGLVWEDEGPADAEAESSSQDRVPDGIEGLTDGASQLRFGRDLRLVEMRRLLTSANPVVIRLANAPEVTDPEMVAQQQQRLMGLAVRTMALPVGRGALTLGTLRPLPTEPLAIPPLCLSGRLPEQHNAIVNLDLSSASPAAGAGAAADFTAWPEFHNGCAAGLRLAPGGAQLTRTWIVYNKPKQPSYTHAGMLMGLGLTGHLSCLSATDLYRYLSQEHDATTVGVLLGMAAAKRGTLDPTISKMLFLHIPSRHPATYPELELSPLVQAAALMGVGLLYQSSCHRLTTEIMMEEIGRRPGNGSSGDNGGTGGNAVAQDREGYALAAGLALGLITLGRGHDAVGLADLHIEDRLRYFMVGGSDPGMMGRRYAHGSSGGGGLPASSSGVFGANIIGFDPTLGGEVQHMNGYHGGGLGRGPGEDGSSGQGVSQVVLEGTLVNLDVTSPGATLALGLMFLKTNDAAMAANFTIPDTLFALDYVRPDFILLRLLARSLIMWDDVHPTREWVEAQLPDLIKGPLKKYTSGQPDDSDEEKAGQPIDTEALGQAHANAIAGACMAIGIKFAGSANAAAQEVLAHYVHYFLEAKQSAPDSAAGAAATWGRLDKQALEVCVGSTALALAAVMAGTGHLPTMRLLRGLRKRLQSGAASSAASSAATGAHGLFFGSHMAISLGLGFLVLGGGTRTFATTNQAVAALVVAMFPKFPHTSMDQRCHLQAFRHLYVLATEARCVEAIDVDTRQSVYVPLKISLDPRAVQRAPVSRDSPSNVLKVSNRRATSSGKAAGKAGSSRATVSPGEAPQAGDDSTGLTFERAAPCLLPERHQVKEITVCGPRYWTQKLAARGGAEVGPLQALFANQTLFVQRKSGALSYADDPSGVRSLLSRAFHKGAGSQQGSFDLVHLCATFSASPFIMSFAQRFCQEASSKTPAGPNPSGPEAADAITEGLPFVNSDASPEEEFRTFCRGALYECITQEKPALLPSYLFLYCLLQGVMGPQPKDSSARNDSGGGGWGVKALTGGLPPTVPLWSLKLALAYHNSTVANATAEVYKERQRSGAEASSSDSSADEADTWQPLLQPSFLEGLWCQLQALWARLAFLPAPPAIPHLLRYYLRTGKMPDAAELGRAGSLSSGEVAWRQELFGAFLAMADLPSCRVVASAVSQTQATASGLKLSHAQGDSVLLSLLSMFLPDTPPHALQHIASCMN